MSGGGAPTISRGASTRASTAAFAGTGTVLHLAHEIWKELASDEYAQNQGGLQDENKDGDFDRDENGQLLRDPTSDEYLKDLKDYNKAR